MVHYANNCDISSLPGYLLCSAYLPSEVYAGRVSCWPELLCSTTSARRSGHRVWRPSTQRTFACAPNLFCAALQGWALTPVDLCWAIVMTIPLFRSFERIKYHHCKYHCYLCLSYLLMPVSIQCKCRSVMVLTLSPLVLPMVYVRLLMSYIYCCHCWSNIHPPLLIYLKRWISCALLLIHYCS